MFGSTAPERVDLGRPRPLAAAPTSSALTAVLRARYDLLMAFVRREVGVRYKEAFAGAAWAVLQPLAFMVLFTFVFARMGKVPGSGPLTAYVALVPWVFASMSIAAASNSILNQLGVVSKIYFPRSVLPLSAIVAAAVDAAIAFGLQIALLIIFGAGLEPTLLLWPLLMVLTGALCLGVGLILAPAVVRFRDLRYLIPLCLQLLLLASPVGYPLSAVPEDVRGLYQLNPFAGLMESFRMIALSGEVPPVGALLPAAAWATGLIAVGALYFRRQESTLADYV